MKETALGHDTSEVVRFAKTEVANIEDVDTWVTRIHHYRWYLAGVMGVLAVVMSLAWLNRQDLLEWMGNTWEFSKLLVPLLFGDVLVVGFLGALIPENRRMLPGLEDGWYQTTDFYNNRVRKRDVASVVGGISDVVDSPDNLGQFEFNRMCDHG